MSTLIARTKPNERGEWDFVGIFEYDDCDGQMVDEAILQLFWTIDEVTDPYGCEFCVLESGMGIFFGRKIETFDGVDEGEDIINYDTPVMPTFTAQLDEMLGFGSALSGHDANWFEIKFNKEEVYSAHIVPDVENNGTVH